MQFNLGLAVETCFRGASASIFCDTFGVKTVFEVREARQSESLALMVQKLLEENAISPKDLGFLCVTRGPGSFTGIRIGLSFALGFAAFLPDLKVLYATSFAGVLGCRTAMEARLEKGQKFAVLLHAIRETYYYMEFDNNFREAGEPMYLEAREIPKTENLMFIGNFDPSSAGISTARILASNIPASSENLINLARNAPNLLTNSPAPLYLRNNSGL